MNLGGPRNTSDHNTQLTTRTRRSLSAHYPRHRGNAGQQGYGNPIHLSVGKGHFRFMTLLPERGAEVHVSEPMTRAGLATKGNRNIEIFILGAFCGTLESMTQICRSRDCVTAR